MTDLWYRLHREGDDVFIDWSEDGEEWRQMRVAHLYNCPAELLVGVYACSPTGPGFTCTVSDLVITLRASSANETADEADQDGAVDA